MDAKQLEAIRARLEEQLRADVELLYEAHRVKLRAFETVLRTQADLAQAPAPAGALSRPLPLPAETAQATATHAQSRTEGWSVLLAIQEKMDRIPEVFDKSDVIRVLGFMPKRATLFRALDELRSRGWITNERASQGRKPARFRKLAHPESERS
jgi:hypothetical protein